MKYCDFSTYYADIASLRARKASLSVVSSAGKQSFGRGLLNLTKLPSLPQTPSMLSLRPGDVPPITSRRQSTLDGRLPPISSEK